MAERLTVDQKVAGSSPVSHPKLIAPGFLLGAIFVCFGIL